MKKIIGLRREDKNEWEKRVPLTPADVKELKEQHGISTIVQPSTLRIFPDSDYQAAGALVQDDLAAAEVILAVKEIPASMFRPGKSYMFFSHTIKGQSYNMPMLKTMADLGCHLFDYERVVDAQNRRLIFFGRYAGLAGMIETLHALGSKLNLQGYETPLLKIKQAYQYASLEDAKTAIAAIGEELNATGLPAELCPLAIGFSGYGHVSRGAQEIFDLLPHKIMAADVMNEMAENFGADRWNLYKIVFREDDLVERTQGTFDLQEYYRHPELYTSKFERYLPYLTALINGIYWAPQYPRLVTKQYLQTQGLLESNLRLLVIGDISCDIDGSIEITQKATKPDHACFTYFPLEDRFQDGIDRLGVSVMAVDNLPCEFPAESSAEFSKVLKAFVPQMAQADMSADFSSIKLGEPLKKAMILQCGKFTPDYQYMTSFIKQVNT